MLQVYYFSYNYKSIILCNKYIISVTVARVLFYVTSILFLLYSYKSIILCYKTSILFLL